MKILIATDGSRASTTACRWIARLALGADSEIRVLRVLEHGEADADAYGALDTATQLLSDSPAQVERSIRRGKAVREVLTASQELAKDAKSAGEDCLVAVGDRGHTPL